ncbi:MAG: sugar phosphate isomerases/epimerase [halophilic archaeon J07HX64]|nr:MAG: sugar phosphate isomerases/epimerase [halophilic archaeon J07HX64]
MDIGVSIGPYVGRIGELPERFSFVELALGEGERPLSAVDPDRVAGDLAAGGFEAVVHLPYRQPLATPVERIDTATREYLAEVLETAAAFGTTTAVAHPRARGSGHDHLVDRMRKLHDRGAAQDITVCFETTGYAGGPSLERVGEAAASAGAAVCLDVGYAYLEAGAGGIESFLGSYGDLVEHLHVHGARQRGDTHIPVGSGDVTYDSLGPVLHEAAPATATMEVFTDDIGHLTDSVERFDAIYGPTGEGSAAPGQ